MRYFFLFFLLSVTLFDLSPLKAKTIDALPSRLPTDSIDFSQKVIALDLTNFTSSSSTQNNALFPVSSSFLTSLLKTLAVDGYDILFNVNDPIFQASIKKFQNNDGFNVYELIDDEVLAYLPPIKLASANPDLMGLLEEKDHVNKSTNYLVLKLGATDKPPSPIQPQYPTSHYATWSLTSEKNKLMEYYWFNNLPSSSSPSPIQGELWLVFSSNATGSSISQPDQAASLSNNSSLQENSTVFQTSSLPPSSSSKNVSQWWKNLTPDQQNGLAKTGLFLMSCGIACFFPEVSLAEKALVVVCIPCFLELGENLSVAWSAFF